MRSLLLFLLLCAPAVLQAQQVDAPDVSRGMRVRVQAPTLFRTRSQGIVWKVSPDTLYLGDLRRIRAALPVTQIEKIEVKRGDDVFKLAGLVGGGAVGWRIGSNASYARERPELSPAWHVVEIAASTAVGAAAGGFLGAIFEAALGWKQVFPERAIR